MRFTSILLRVGLSFVLTICLIDAVVRTALPRLVRLESNFSAAYLRKTLDDPRTRASIAFLGDSVLWGYKLPAADNAVARIAQLGIPDTNLAFEGGSMANTYALLRYMEVHNALPHFVIFNVNLKEFNPADSAYQTLSPSLEQLVWADLSSSERALLKRTQPTTLDARIDRALGRIWFVYGARTDIREMSFGQSDAASAVEARLNELSGEAARLAAAHIPTPDRFLGTYDLSPLSDGNVEVAFLRKTIALIKRHHLRAVGILTPTNHKLLHDYIDVPEYGRQLAQVAGYMRAGDIRVLNYDACFDTRYFIDNDHLNARGSALLASRVYRELAL